MYDNTPMQYIDEKLKYFSSVAQNIDILYTFKAVLTSTRDLYCRAKIREKNG